MEIERRQIEDILNSSQGYTIPFYQRNYDWTVNDVEKLLSDIYKNKVNDYFLGSLFLKNKGNSLIVIDGQQRITTLSLIVKQICNIKDKLSLENQKILENKFHKIFEKKFIFKTEKSFSSRVLSDIIANKEIDSNGQKTNYWINLEKIKEKLNIYNLDKFFSNLLKVMFAEIKVDNEVDEHIIFSQINSTGKKLNSFDLIKNNLFDELLKEYQDNDIDEYIEENLSKLDEVSSYLKNMNKPDQELNDLFRRFLSMYHPNLINNDDNAIYNEYLEVLNEWKKLNYPVKKFFDDFFKFASIYKFIYNQEFKKESKKWAFYDELDFIIDSFKTYSNILILVFKNYCEQNNNSTTFKISEENEEKINNILKILNYYRINRFFSNKKDKTITRRIPLISKAIKENSNFDIEQLIYYFVIDEPNEASSINGKNYAIDKKEFFEDSFTTFNAYESNGKFVKKLLLRINSSYDNKSSIKEEDKVTVEHIFPQENSEWIKELELSPNDVLIVQKFIHTIGNLTVTLHNSELSNKLYKDKINLLKKTNGFAINNLTLLDVEKWDVDEIKNRSKELLKKVNEIYNFDNLKKLTDLDKQKLKIDELNEFELLNKSIQNIKSNLTYFKEVRDILNKDLIKHMCKMHLLDKIGYEKIDKQIFNKDYTKGWISHVIVKFIIKNNVSKKDDFTEQKFEEFINSKQNEMDNVLEIIDEML